MLLYSIVSNILSVASLAGPLAGCERFRGVSIRSVPVAVGLSVKLNVTAGEGVSIASGGSVEERELLNEELDRETGDQAWSSSWLLNISLFKSPGHGLFCLLSFFLLLVY